MAKGDVVARVLKAGQGKPGYCKLCSLQPPRLQDEFDQRVLDYSPVKLNAWMKTRVEGWKPADRATVYKHRKHVMHPQDKVVNAVQRRAQNHGVQAPRTSEQEFLDAVIAAGRANLTANPEAITVDQALKATQISQQGKQRGDANQTLVAIFTGNYKPEDIIEGEYTET